MYITSSASLAFGTAVLIKEKTKLPHKKSRVITNKKRFNVKIKINKQYILIKNKLINKSGNN